LYLYSSDRLSPLICSQTTSEYEAVLLEATSKLQAGNSDGALLSAQRAINLDLARWDAYAIAGEALMKLYRYDEAKDVLGKAIEIAPEKKRGALLDLRAQCSIAESTSVAQSASKTSGVASSQAGRPNGTLKTSSQEGLDEVEDLQKESPTMKRVPSAGKKAIFDVCFSPSRNGDCESIGQLTIKAGRLSYSARTRNQSFSGKCSDISDLSSFTTQAKAAPSFRASAAEGITLRVLGREAVFFLNSNATAEGANSVDAIVDKIKRQCPDVESKR
jgi:tetratricopeptide (TPR) repeat protein